MMYPDLQVLLYADYSASPRFIADLTSYVADIQISAAAEGGVRDIDILLGYSKIESFLLAYRHNGKRLVVVDYQGEPVAEGTIMMPSVIEVGNRITCQGPYWDLCFRQVYNDASSWVDTGTSSEVIKDILTTECPAVNSDQTEIEETSTDVYPWQTAENAYPGELISRLVGMSDSSNREWYFQLRSAPLNNGAPRAPIAHFHPHDLDTVQFWFSRKDCPPDGFELSPSLIELANDVRVMYRDSAGTQQQTDAASDAESQARYWLREVHDVTIATVPQTVAEQYRDMYLERYKKAQQSISFRLNGWIQDRLGSRVPLWKVIQKFPCNIGIRDLDPIPGILGDTTGSVDRERVFTAAAVRYSYANNMLMVTPDLEEKTMENLLALWMGAG